MSSDRKPNINSNSLSLNFSFFGSTSFLHSFGVNIIDYDASHSAFTVAGYVYQLAWCVQCLHFNFTLRVFLQWTTFPCWVFMVMS